MSNCYAEAVEARGDLVTENICIAVEARAATARERVLPERVQRIRLLACKRDERRDDERQLGRPWPARPRWRPLHEGGDLEARTLANAPACWITHTSCPA